ncbi:MAG: organomercurial lyase [Candidatus Hydrothermarchaeaceae archaeon]
MGDESKLEEKGAASESCGPPDPSMISPEMKKVYLYVSDTLFEQGRRPSIEEISKGTELPESAVGEILDAFESVYGIYRDPFFKHVIAFYPVSGIPTIHKLIRPEGGRIAYSPCAMDALTLPPTFGKDLEIKSSCRYCDAEISINYGENGTKITEHSPDGIWIWLENRIPSNAPYYLIVCVNSNFFCSKDHLDMWLKEETMERSGKAYSLADAFSATEDWCTYKMYKLVTEGRPWGGKALDEV